MATKVVLPVLGQTMEEGTITRWLKNEGDQIDKGEPLLEVMTDKVNMEVEAPESGILLKILAQVDEIVPIMAAIAIVGAVGETVEGLVSDTDNGTSALTAVAESTQAAASSPDVVTEMHAASGDRLFISPRARKRAKESGIPVEALTGRGTGPDGRVVEKDVEAYIAESEAVTATPLAARIAADQGIDLKEVAGTGLRGKVTKGDVLQASAHAQIFPTPHVGVIPFTGMRKMVADNVAKSAQTAPHVTLTTGVDMTEAVKLRTLVVDHFEKKYGTRLTFTDLIVKAAASALLRHPIVNSSLQGNEIRILEDVSIGVAVALDGGLAVPVSRNADRKNLSQISVELKELIEKAKTGNLATHEITGTFTITNLGAFGIDVFNPIITPGQSAILGVCRIAEKPVVVDGQVVVRSMMNLCLSFDHRVMDGAPAAQFLKTVKDLLESPFQLLI